MVAELSPDEIATVSIEVTDRRGRPAQIDGEPSWSAEPADVLVLDVAEGGMSCDIVAADDSEDDVAHVLCDIDADLGEGVELLRGVLTVAVTGGTARFVDLQISSRRARDDDTGGEGPVGPMSPGSAA